MDEDYSPNRAAVKTLGDKQDVSAKNDNNDVDEGTWSPTKSTGTSLRETCTKTKDAEDKFNHHIKPLVISCQNKSNENPSKNPVDKKLIHVYISWKDITGTNEFTWQMLGCSICEKSLSTLKEHATNHHSHVENSCYSQTKDVLKKTEQTNYNGLFHQQLQEKHSQNPAESESCKIFSKLDHSDVANKTHAEASVIKHCTCEQKLPSHIEEKYESFSSVKEADEDTGGNTFEFKGKLDTQREQTLSQQKNNSKRFSCDSCGKTFLAKSHHSRHMLVHSEMQTCNICGKVCKNVRSLQRHLKQGHPDSVNDDIDNKEHTSETNTESIAGSSPKHLVDQEWTDMSIDLTNETFVENKVNSAYSVRNVTEVTALNGEENSGTEQEQLNVNFRKDNRRKVFLCNVCSKTFKGRCFLKRHMLMHTGTQKCDICQNICKNVRSLQRHVKLKHQDYVKHTNVESGGDETCEDKNVNCKTNSGNLFMRYPCRSANCKKTFSLLKKRICHEKEKHNGKALECSICHKSFSTKCHYDRHMSIHTEKKQCDFCKKLCKNARTLKNHRQMHINGELVCQFCGKTFSNPSSLKTHEKIHTGDKKFKCEFCEKSFIKSSDLKIHKQRHTGFMFVCMHCGYGCATKLLLENHEALHTGVKAHECDDCNRRFRTAGQLYNHKLQHQEKRFSCSICSKKFRWKCDLRTHNRMHQGQRLHKCDACDKTFVDVSNKWAHIKQVHMGIKRTGHGKTKKPRKRPTSCNKLESEELSETSTFETEIFSQQYPTMVPHTVVSTDVKLPHQQRSTGAAQGEGGRPDNDFYSMVDTLIQFSKDN